MPRFKKQVELGLRWATCGWRLFRRSPWLLAGMGIGAAAVIFGLATIPFFGAPLIGLLLPTVIGAVFIVLDATVSQTPHRLASAKAAARALAAGFADEGRILQLLVASLFSMAIALLAAMLTWQLAGSAWWLRPELDPMTYARAAVAALLVLVVGSVAAAAFVYALPLAFLQQQPSLPAATRSFRAAGRHAGALAVLEGILLLPLVLGVAVSFFQVGLAYFLTVIGTALVLPVVVASLYCSYRTLFPVSERRPAARPGKPREAAAPRG